MPSKEREIGPPSSEAAASPGLREDYAHRKRRTCRARVGGEAKLETGGRTREGQRSRTKCERHLLEHATDLPRQRVDALACPHPSPDPARKERGRQRELRTRRAQIWKRHQGGTGIGDCPWLGGLRDGRAIGVFARRADCHRERRRAGSHHDACGIEVRGRVGHGHVGTAPLCLSERRTQPNAALVPDRAQSVERSPRPRRSAVVPPQPEAVDADRHRRPGRLACWRGVAPPERAPGREIVLKSVCRADNRDGSPVELELVRAQPDVEISAEVVDLDA